jgi:hypothetical protein
MSNKLVRAAEAHHFCWAHASLLNLSSSIFFACAAHMPFAQSSDATAELYFAKLFNPQPFLNLRSCSCGGGGGGELVLLWRWLLLLLLL